MGSRAVIVAAGIGALLLLPAAGATPPVTTRVSVDSTGTQSNGHSGSNPAISADGCTVAFSSLASNLVAGDTNGVDDVFVHECRAGSTTRVSVDSAGGQANGAAARPAVSADGRFVAFQSTASNLVEADTNGVADIFVHDRQSGTTTRVSVGAGGAQADRASATPAISAGGHYVAFQSLATNLVAGDTSGFPDIFVRDLASGTTTRVSVSAAGEQANNSSFVPTISADGRVVAFFSPASNLVAGDTNNTYDAFAHDRGTGLTRRASVDSAGVEGNDFTFETAVSGNGRFVAFQSLASNLVEGDTNRNFDIFVHDLETGATARVSVSSDGLQGINSSYSPTLSFEGRTVAFQSVAQNLVEGDTNGATDVFVHDRDTATTTRSSVSSNGSQANGASYEISLSGDGRWAAYRSRASNLVAADTNGVDDIFVAAPRPRVSSGTVVTPERR